MTIIYKRIDYNNNCFLRQDLAKWDNGQMNKVHCKAIFSSFGYLLFDYCMSLLY